MKRKVLALVMLIAATPLVGAAQQENEFTTNQPGVTTIAAPSASFDPLRASDEELAFYGFPPRPNANSADYASWANAMAASQTRIVPVLESTKIYHGPNWKLPSADANTAASYNWSGYVKQGSAKSYGKASVSAVSSNITVPTARVAFGTCTGQPVYASGWVGIDGSGSNDVLQDGIEFDAECISGKTETLYSAWFEWYPFSETRISNLPIGPGDKFFIEVWSTSSTKGHAYLVNTSRKKAVTINFSAPSGTKLIGNSAEWITERPGVNGTLATLTNYVSQTYTNAHASTFAGAAIDPGNSIPIVMLDNKNKPISYPKLLSATSFVMKDEGSAY